MNETRACALLARAPGLDAQRLRACVAELGCIERVAEGHEAACARLLPARALLFLAAPPASLIEADLRWLEASGARLIPCTSPDYPPALAALARAPAVLYVLGNPHALRTPQIAMVGARSATAAGRATAAQFAAAFARAGLTVVSGLALGIDTASHAGALEGGGLTVAVCGHGLAHLYPRENRVLARRIRARGALLSALPPHAPVRPWHFPERNRLISALALATLVVEAGHGSGSLITARCARQLGRRVFAVPGSIRDPAARGCHELIRGGATLIESPADVLQELGIPFDNQMLAETQVTASSSRPRGPPLDKAYEMLLDALGFEPASLDQLGARTGIPSAALTGMLLMLELGGRVAPHPGGCYCRLS